MNFRIFKTAQHSMAKICAETASPLVPPAAGIGSTGRLESEGNGNDRSEMTT
jgi:hypothetical protein